MEHETLRLSSGYPGTSPFLSADVRLLQTALQGLGFSLDADGRFGPLTEEAVKAYQRRIGLADDGVVGPATWSALLPDGAVPVMSSAPPPVPTPSPRPEGGALFPEGGALFVEAPWYSQYDPAHVERAGSKACYRACRAMARAIGVIVPAGPANRIQVALSEDRSGRVTTTPDRTDEARRYIDAELLAGRPVTVGVSHRDTNYNVDRITDHYVLITGRGQDDVGVYYLYNDPATHHRTIGQGQRFRVDAQTGNLVHAGRVASGPVVNRHTELSMVVRNAR